MNPENDSQAEAAAPLKPKSNSVLLRRSTRVFRGREPPSGAAAGILGVCCSLIFALILLAILNALSIASIIIGAIYLDAVYCPGEPNLAPVLIASGVMAIFLSIFEGRSRVLVAKDGSEETVEKKDCFFYFLSFLRFVKFGVFIYFCVLVFTLNSHVKFEHYNPGPDELNYYCQPTLFLFSFWLIIFILVCAAIAIGFCCCCVCCAILCVGVAAAAE